MDFCRDNVPILANQLCEAGVAMLVEILGIRIDFTHILGATNNPAGLTYRNIVGEEGRRTAVDFGNDRLIRVLVDDLAIEQRAVPRRRTREIGRASCRERVWQ